jgi:hypothetical protein
MNFKSKLQEINNKLLDIISTKEISYLKDLDKRIKFNKYGKFHYHKIYEYNIELIYNFIKELHSDKIYTLIPIISANNKPDEPIIILSQQILITNNSNVLLFREFLNDKIRETLNLYGVNNIEKCKLIFKFKEVKINFNDRESF